MASVIFIGSPQRTMSKDRNLLQKVKGLFYVSASDIMFRIFSSFVPPFNTKFRKVYIDLQGPLIAIVILTALVNYGYSFKATHYFKNPTDIVVAYGVCMPLLCFILCKLGRSSINLLEATSLVGYGLYGHILTLFISFMCHREYGNFGFFICLIVFAGLSTIRIALIILGTLTLPAVRLLVCTIISVINILFIIYLHFAYIHQTFTYKAHSKISN